jgi:hypothetical protein
MVTVEKRRRQAEAKKLRVACIDEGKRRASRDAPERDGTSSSHPNARAINADR